MLLRVEEEQPSLVVHLCSTGTWEAGLGELLE